MSSGGIKGRPVVINGKAGGDPGPATGAVLDITSKLASPQSGRFAFARSLRVRNLDAFNDLLLYINDEDPMTFSQGDATFAFEATVHRVAVQASFQGQDAETSAALATDAALPAYTQAGAGVGATLTADAVGVLTVDGVATVLNDRILVKDGAAGADNGLYAVTTEGEAGVAFILTRVTDHDLEISSGDFVGVTGGTANAGLTFQITTTGAIVVDTTAITWEEMASLYEIIAVVAA